MATKPLTLPEAWATNAVYLTGPFPGQPGKVDPGVAIAAEGHRPGAAWPSAAEHENYQQFQITSWVRDWLSLGSSTGVADAHLVETDGTGRATLQGLTVNNALTQTAVFITSNGLFAPAVSATNTAGADIYRANLGGTAGTAFSSTLTGLSTGLKLAMNGMNAGVGHGIDILGNGTTTQSGIFVTMGSTARAVDAVSSAGNAVTGAAISGTGGDFGSQSGEGVKGQSLSAAGGHFNSLNGAGALVTSTNGVGATVTSTNGTGATVTSTNANGLVVTALHGIGAQIIAQDTTGLTVTTVNGTGTIVNSTTGIGATISSTLNTGAAISSTNGVGAILSSTNGVGARVSTLAGTDALTASTTGTGRALLATSTSGTTITATATSGKAIVANATTNNAIVATTTTGTTIVASATGGQAIVATSDTDVAITAVSNADYGLRVQGATAFPIKGEMKFTGQTSRPTLDDNGQVSWLTNETQLAHSNDDDNTWRGIWSSVGGYCRGAAFFAYVQTVFNDLVIGYQTYAAVSALIQDSPKLPGRQIYMRVSIQAETSAANIDTTLNLRIRDDTANTIVFGPKQGLGNAVNNGFLLRSNGSAVWTSNIITFLAPITVPIPGVRQWSLQLCVGPGGQPANIRLISMEFLGLS